MTQVSVQKKGCMRGDKALADKVVFSKLTPNVLIFDRKLALNKGFVSKVPPFGLDWKGFFAGLVKEVVAERRRNK